jgi:hypothetical protein
MNPTDRQKKKTASSTKAAPAPAKDANPGGLTDGQLVLTPAEGRVFELRQAAVDYVQRAIGCELDDSEESLAFVDHYLDRVRRGGELRDEVLQLVAVALGVYLGEVMRTKFGGRWVALPPAPSASTGGETPILDSIDEPVGWRLQLAAVPLLVDPIGMALRALRPPVSTGPTDAPPAFNAESEAEAERAAGEALGAQGEQEDPVGFATTPALTAPLRAALARLPPVAEDYYYSLTGRFETLTYVVELIAEMQHQEAERTAPPAAAEAEAD